jgi:hypothetical protein
MKYAFEGNDLPSVVFMESIGVINGDQMDAVSADRINLRP